MKKKTKIFVSPPSIEQSTVLMLGTGLFLLALVWPPLILVVTYLLSILLPYAFRVNDDAASRRILFQKFSKEKDLPQDWKCIPPHIDLTESYWPNARGMCLCTSTMVPKDGNIRAVLCFCHGYTDNSSFMKRVEYQRFVNRGIAVVTIEYEGHGRSDGQLGYIEDWELLVDDVETFFAETMKKQFPNKKCFLMGESMGGAVCFSAYRRNPHRYSGVVFNAPMCKVADDMMPPDYVIKAFRFIVTKLPFLASLPLAPAKGDLKNLSFHVEEKRDLVQRSPTSFSGRKPRLATARVILVSSLIFKSLCCRRHYMFAYLYLSKT